MKLNKLLLLAAVATSAMGAGVAQAQSVFNAAELDGAGGTLTANIQRQAYDCYGAQQPLAFSGTTTPANIFDFSYPATGAGTGATAAFPCATRIVQPNITARYLGTGSGAGVNAFLFHASPEAYPGSTQVLPPGFASYVYGVQFIGSDNPLSAANITAYNTTSLAATTARDGVTPIAAGTAASRYGAPIQLPLFLAPVAIGYSAVYAKEINGGGFVNTFKFLVAGARADGSGGMKLTRAQYCGIMTGTLHNWNQLPTSVVNKDPNDVNLNWATTGVPMQLIGRSDSSGTTTLFSRAIARQCDGIVVNTGVNGVGSPVTLNLSTTFANSASTLPAALRNSGVTFVKATFPATGSQVGADIPGIYRVAAGNDGVAQALAYHPDPSGPAGTRTSNGQVGYIGPDFALPAVLYTGQNPYGLNTASLQQNGTGTTFNAPTAKLALAAFTGIQPPQSKGTAGAYCTDAAACPTAYGDRANPLDWVQSADKSVSLAAPTKGYPIVGTSQIDLYTCYDSSDARKAVVGLFATFLNKTLLDSTGTTATSKIPPTLFTNAINGVIAKNGLSAMPGAWLTAMSETFFKNSVQVGKVGDTTTKLGLRNLWIQDKIPTTATGTGSITNGNPGCAGLPGA